jgi:hypothetical protein
MIYDIWDDDQSLVLLLRITKTVLIIILIHLVNQ